MEDVQNIGGTPGLIKFLIDNDLFDGDQMTVTGKTHKQNLEDLNHPGLTPGQEIIRPVSDPIKETGHLQIMYGNLCPGGGVAKITGKEGETFTVSEYPGKTKVVWILYSVVNFQFIRVSLVRMTTNRL
jgi:dihydroxy-acid dehydratase